MVSYTLASLPLACSREHIISHIVNLISSSVIPGGEDGRSDIKMPRWNDVTHWVMVWRYLRQHKGCAHNLVHHDFSDIPKIIT